MFGGPIEKPKPPSPRRYAKWGKPDILMPHVDLYGHRARNPGTDYHRQLLHHKQRRNEINDKEKRDAEFWTNQQLGNIRMDIHIDKKYLRQKINQRLQEKLDEQEMLLNGRRQRLAKLLGDEERECVRETVNLQQIGDLTKIDDMREKCKNVKEQREKERMELVRKKRIQQYCERCVELRPLTFHKRLIETKFVQQQQMRENAMRREREKETDAFWADVARKQDQTLLERETHEALLKYENNKNQMEQLEMQLEGKKKLNEERLAIMQSDKEEMQKLIQRNKEEQLNEQIRERKRQQDAAEDLQNQLKIHQKIRDERKRREEALDKSFKELCELELQKEQASIKDMRNIYKQETLMYLQQVEDLKVLRKKEEEETNKMIQEYVTKKQRMDDEIICKQRLKKEEFLKTVLKVREEQIEYKKEIAEKEKQLKKEYAESVQKINELNQKLDMAMQQKKRECARSYRNDLLEQVEYNHNLKKREMEKMEDELKKSIEEESNFRETVNWLLNGAYDEVLERHPFRNILEQYDCHCAQSSETHQASTVI